MARARSVRGLRLRIERPEVIGLAMNPAYDAYMLSEHWRLLKSQLFTLRGHQCAICRHKGQFNPIVAHHLIYRTPLESGIVTDLMLVCLRCHDVIHAHVPPFPVETPTSERYVRTVAQVRRYVFPEGLKIPPQSKPPRLSPSRKKWLKKHGFMPRAYR